MQKSIEEKVQDLIRIAEINNKRFDNIQGQMKVILTALDALNHISKGRVAHEQDSGS